MKTNNSPISKTRQIYLMRLIGRIMVFITVVLIYAFDREKFNIASGMNFFDHFSILKRLIVGF